MFLLLNMTDVCDKAICDIANGQKDALSVLYREYGRMIYSVAFQIVRDSHDAEDVLQDTMVKIIRLSHTYRRGTNPKAWIMAITRNCAVDKLKNKNTEVSLDSLVSETGEKHFTPAQDELVILQDALNTLSHEEQLIIKLKIHIGLSHSEIASVIGKSTVAVRKQYQRSLGKLKEYYEKG